MKKLLILFLMTVAVHSSFGQDTYFQPITPEQDSIARSLTEIYAQKLALTGQQELIFKNRLVEFYIKKEELRNSDLMGKAKLDALYGIGQQENLEMRDIVLTQEQYDLYVRIKPSIQPLQKIKPRE